MKKTNSVRPWRTRKDSALAATGIIGLFAIAGVAYIVSGHAAPNPNLIGNLNSDNVVNLTDLSMLLSNWGKTIAATPTPTPPTPTLPTPVPSGPVLYVAVNGNDINNGTSEGSAKKTISAALSTASAGYTILVGDGTYNGNLIINKGGSAGKYITIKSQNKWGATIFGNNSTSNQSGVEMNAQYVRLQDFTITGSTGIRNGILIGASNLDIIGNHIHTICQFQTDGTSWKGGAGIDISADPSSNLLIDSNVINNVGLADSTAQLVHGMYLSSHVTNGRVTNNLIYRIEDFGLHPYDDTEASGWQFINNTIAYTGRGILQAPNGVTRNNIVYDVKGTSYDIRGSGNTGSNNLSFGSGGTDGTSVGVTTADPMFVNPTSDGSGDFHLKSGSPAIDKGSASGAPAADILGIGRPKGAGIDIGAYEQQ